MLLLIEISIHALREEGDPPTTQSSCTLTYFYPRPPRGGRLKRQNWWTRCSTFLSTPSARRATPGGDYEHYDYTISIHALREEGDDLLQQFHQFGVNISIHALREEGDRFHWPYWVSDTDFYPRPPRGGRRFSGITSSISWAFLSTPSARRATARNGRRYQSKRFLSTPSARRATYLPARLHPRKTISIHALREEGDVAPCKPF